LARNRDEIAIDWKDQHNLPRKRQETKTKKKRQIPTRKQNDKCQPETHDKFQRLLIQLNTRERSSGSSSDDEEEEKTKMVTLREIQGDLFESRNSSLAHCVSRDLNMGKGIAVDFKAKYKRVNELKAQQKGIGDVAVIGTSFSYTFSSFLLFLLLTFLISIRVEPRRASRREAEYRC